MSITPMTMIRDRLRRDLDPEELRLAVSLLDEAESRLLTRIPDALERIVDDETWAVLFRSTAASAVLRVLVNPDGYRQESVGPYGWTYDTRAAAGFLTILDEEWSTLGAGSSAAFTVPVSLPPPWVRESGPLVPFNPLTSPLYWGDLS